LAQLRLGLLDPPDMNPYTKIPRDAANSHTMRALALQAAREGIVLLHNRAGVLPLKASRLQQQGAMAVVGPNAKLVAFGSYSNSAGQMDNVTALQGLQRRVAKLAFASGCTIAGNGTSGFGPAVQVAKAASVTVAVMGIDDTQEHETGTRSIVHLPGVQLELLKALKAASTKLVLVLVGGSAMAVLVALDVKVLFILPSILCMVIPNEAYRAA
jgi:beta-glucosidase